MKIMKDIVRPTLVLVLVCVVVSGLLALTYNLAGVAELANAGYTAEELQTFAAAALPEADVLEKVKLSDEEKPEGLKDLYIAENGAGYGVVVVSKGYSSDGITMMVGLSGDGTVLGVHVISHTETPGIGDKVTVNEEFLARYSGKTESDVPVDVIAGATKTSTGMNDGVKAAIEILNQLKGEGV